MKEDIYATDFRNKGADIMSEQLTNQELSQFIRTQNQKIKELESVLQNKKNLTTAEEMLEDELVNGGRLAAVYLRVLKTTSLNWWERRKLMSWLLREHEQQAKGTLWHRIRHWKRNEVGEREMIESRTETKFTFEQLLVLSQRMFKYAVILMGFASGSTAFVTILDNLGVI